MRRLMIAGLAFAVAAILPAQQPTDFQKDVLPILERSCLECHRSPYKDENGRTRNPKAGLRLDGRGWIMAGSNNEKVVKPGDPGDSLLYVLTTLDPGDDGFMPRKSKALTISEQSVLERWIKEGASFGSWVGTGGPTVVAAAEREPVEVTTPVALQPVVELGAGLEPLPSSVISRAAGSIARITPVTHGSPLLRVAYLANEDQLDDRTVTALAPIGGRVTQLILARTGITDRGLGLIAGMKRLTRLDLCQTAVTDRGLERLEKLPELRTLNLYGTSVTDKGLRHLEKIKTLRRITLWETKVTEAGVERLREALPGVTVVRVLVLPPAEENRGNRNRRRRG